MHWETLDIAATVGVTKSPGSIRPLIDPYWVWAEVSDWREFVLDMPAFGNDRVSFIGQLIPGKSVADLQAEAAAVCAIDVPAIYACAGLPESGSHYITGRVQREALPWLAKLTSLARWELGAPVRPADVQDAVTVRGDSAADTAAPAAESDRASALMGVIDDGLAALHKQFRQGSGSRVRLLWDQGVKAEAPVWQVPANFGYGRQLLPHQLASTVSRRANAATAGDETTTYRDWNYLLGPRTLIAPRPVWRATHGTHVMHVAAGAQDPLLPTGSKPDAAADCELAFVGLPDTTVSDSSGGSLPVHVLDGMRAIFAECEPDAAVVVNLSYGCQGGSHDGSSLLELAMDDLLQRRSKDGSSRSAIVVSAGNSALTRSHACMQVTPEVPAYREWEVPQGDNTDSFLEIWYPVRRGVQMTVSVSVTAPGGQAAQVTAGEAAVLRDDARRALAAIVHQKHVPTGENAMALLALAPTAPRDGGTAAPAGTWRIAVSSTHPVEVHAYIERDDPVPKSSKPPSAFVAGSTPQGTLNGIATGKHVFVAGGCVQGSGRVADYSSQGPTRDHRLQTPHALASCERSATQPGVRAAAVRSADTLLMNGTSVAAPMLARRLLNLLQGGHRIDLDDLPATVQKILAPARRGSASTDQPPLVLR